MSIKRVCACVLWLLPWWLGSSTRPGLLDAAGENDNRLTANQAQVIRELHPQAFCCGYAPSAGTDNKGPFTASMEMKYT